MDTAVKLRSAAKLAPDASYKVPGLMARYKGEKLYGAMQTVTNEAAEIRSMSFTMTDAHDQIEQPMRELDASAVAYNQPRPTMLASDKPLGGDFNFYTHVFPTLKQSQAHLDANVSSVPSSDELPACELAGCEVRIIENAREIGDRADAIIGLLGSQPPAQQVVSVDIEWDVELTASGLRREAREAARPHRR